MTNQSAPRTTTTVVVEEKKRRKAPLLWVAAAAACLLAGGGTFALWQDQAVFSGGTITAGNLDLVTDSTPSYYDVSTISGDPNPAASSTTGLIKDASLLRLDETDTIANTTALGHKIDLSQWQITPGDTVAAVYDAKVILKGDNLVADLQVNGAGQVTAAQSDGTANHDLATPAPSGTPGTDENTSANNAADATDSEESGSAITSSNGFTDGSANDLAFGYALYQDGVLLNAGAVPSNGTIATFASPASSQAGGGTTDVGTDANGNKIISVDASGTSSVTVVITANLNKDLEHRQDVSAAATLNQLTMTLAQNRTVGVQNAIKPSQPAKP